MADNLLAVRDLCIAFSNKRDSSIVQAVDRVSFTIPRSKTIAMVGESGSGKSVIALALMGLLPQSHARITSGEILFEGRDLLKLDAHAMQAVRGLCISLIFQEPMTSLNPVLTVGHQITEGLIRHKGLRRRDARREAVDLFGKVGIPDPQRRIDFYPHQLSGGQRQRVMIAIAISCQPQLVIADEPTTALDVTVQKQIIDLLRQLQKQSNLSLLFITHDLALAGTFADEVIVIRKGSIVEQGACPDVFTNPQHAYTRALLACRPSVSANPPRLPTVDDFMDGRPLRLAGKADRRPKGATVIDVRNVSKRFPVGRSLLGQAKEWVAAVDNVSLSIREGQTMGLVGESGSGKTTLGRTLARLLEPSAGTIHYRGKDLSLLSAADMRDLRRRIQIIFQDPFASLDPRMTIERTLTEPLVIHGVGANQAERRRIAEEIMERCGMPNSVLGRHPHEFSGGQRQRICIARALVIKPEFVICDESVSALDVSVQAQILNLLADLQEDFNLTYLFISHDLAAVRFIADEICVMNKGKIVEVAKADHIYEHPAHPYTRTLIGAVPRDIAARPVH